MLFSACGILPAPADTPTPVAAFATLAPTQPPVQPADGQPAQACPNPDCVVITPAKNQAEPLRLSLPTPGPEPRTIWRPAQFPVPLALGPYDHFYFSRPISANEINWPLANYRYGGVFFKDVTHTGVDIPAEPGTPVLAAGPGTVVWADWGLFTGTPNNYNDPYGRAVVIRHDFGYISQPLYTVYAHMREIYVTPGQWVDIGTPIGEVGDTGATTGPHLHIEVRVGENSYYDTRNPELWIAPPQGWGVLAGRVMETNKRTINSFEILIHSEDTGREWTVKTYGPEAVNPDPYYNENMAISDLPAGKYTVSLVYNGKEKRLGIEIVPGRITYFTFRGDYGFSTDPPAPPAATATVSPIP